MKPRVDETGDEEPVDLADQIVEAGSTDRIAIHDVAREEVISPLHDLHIDRMQEAPVNRVYADLGLGTVSQVDHKPQ